MVEYRPDDGVYFFECTAVTPGAVAAHAKEGEEHMRARREVLPHDNCVRHRISMGTIAPGIHVRQLPQPERIRDCHKSSFLCAALVYVRGLHTS